MPNSTEEDILKILSDLYRDFSISDTEKSEFRDILYELICSIPYNKSNRPITQFISSHSKYLQQEFDKKKMVLGLMLFSKSQMVQMNYSIRSVVKSTIKKKLFSLAFDGKVCS